MLNDKQQLSRCLKYLSAIFSIILIIFGCSREVKNNELIIIHRDIWNALNVSQSASMYRYTDSLENVLTRIIIHHSAFPDQPGPLYLQEYQIFKMGYDDIVYHFLIGEDGVIYEGRLIEYMGAHAGQTKEANNLANRIRAGLIQVDIEEAMRLDPDYGSIGVCLDGNFDLDEPGEYQLESLRRLVEHLKDKYNINGQNVLLHKEVIKKIVKRAGLTPAGEETVCPGEVGANRFKKYLNLF